MTRNIPIGVYVTPDQYRALTHIADAQHQQVHHLIEGLVARALTRPTGSASPRKKSPPLDSEAVRRLHAEGLLDREIAEHLGAHLPTVRQVRRALKLPSNHVRVPIDLDELRRLHALKFNDQQIAEHMQRSPSAICKWRAQLDLPKNSPHGRPRLHWPQHVDAD